MYIGLHTAHLTPGEQLIKRAFQLPDVGLDVGGQILGDITWQLDTMCVGFGLQDGAPGLKVRILHVDAHPPRETGAQPVFQRGNIAGRLVAAHDDLPICLMKRIKGMEELFLCFFFAGDKLYVIYN
jgi:hypothetical protein